MVDTAVVAETKAESDGAEGAADTVDTLLGAETPAQAVDETATDGAAKDEAKDGEPKEGADDKAKDEAKGGAPEAYEAFVLPEGVEADQAALDAFLPVAKDLNLTQAQAQKLVDLRIAQVAQETEQQNKNWIATNDKWVADAKADAEIGGEKFDENVAVARKAIDAFGTPELKAALAATGAGNHPEFIRFCTRVGAAIGEDKIISGQNGGGKRSAAEIIYDNT